MSESVNTEQTPRLCHVIKKENFDGYGFNLHAEKGKPGQYIGKVDDGSPAETSGLKQGDRILEVNGCSIGNETHKQVVQRIKALANEVQLLVVDSNVNVTSDNRLVENVPSSNGNIRNEITPDNNILAKTNDDDAVITNKKPSNESSMQQQVAASSNDNVNTITPEPKHASEISMKSDDSNNDLSSSPTGDHTDSTTINEKTLIHQNQQKNSNNSNSSSSTATTTTTANNTNNTSTAKEGLNLNMTAAELRAKLAAKKKFDPKTDAVDLRQKFEIIQKL